VDTVFAETLRYADIGKNAAARRFDGNISETAFSHRVVPAIGSPGLQTNTWSYAYDEMKRLTGANHYPSAAQTPSLTDTEREIAYDRNGNIITLKRYGASGLENDLEFTHTGNRMTSLSDANATGSASGSKSFNYDENGNLTSDGRKGLEFSWNVLNLLDSATAHDGSSLKYSWLSDGTKVASVHDDGNVLKRHYVGSFVFVEDPESGEWAKESVAWDEGRIFFDVPFIVDSTVVDDPLVEDRGYRDCWYATDHLENVRAVIDITPGMPAPQILEQSDYLPFGTKILNPAHASMPSNRWRYAGKEEQDFGSLNLGLLDFGARMYDPFTARWTAVDPMAGKSGQMSPYNYCGGDPVNRIDPDGNWVWVAIGAAIEYGSQVYNNLQKGATGYDAWVVDVNFVRVGLSAVNPGKKLFLAKTILVEGAKAAISYKPNDGLSINHNVEDVAKETVKNTVINATVGKVLDASSPQAVETTAKEASDAAKKVSSARHKASRNTASPKAASSLSEAEGKASASGAKAAGTKALNNTIGANPEATKAAINYINTALENETDKQRRN
jgi:RHS repeat-associated protein